MGYRQVSGPGKIKGSVIYLKSGGEGGGRTPISEKWGALFHVALEGVLTWASIVKY